MIIELDKVDKRILFELERNARMPDVKLAKLVGKSKDAVRYRTQRLEKEGVIVAWKTWIDMAKIGYRSSTIYLTLMNLPNKRKKLLAELKNDKRTYWIGVAEGVWNIGVTYFVKSTQELFEIKNGLLSRYSDLIIESKIASLVSVSVHEKTFLAKQKSSLITFTEGVENIKLDEISKNILRGLYFNSRENIATLAERYKTTVDIIRSRIKKMEEQGVIIRYTTQIDYQKIGYGLYKSFIYLKSFNKKQFDEMLRYAEESDKIINIVKQIAPWDIEFIVFTKNFQDYNHVVNEFTEKFSKIIKKIETSTMSEDIIFPCKTLVFD